MPNSRQPPVEDPPRRSLPGVQSPARTEDAGTSPLSLSRLRAAFASMLGPQEDQGARSEERAEQSAASRQNSATCTDPCEINPRSVVEAMLFVGRPDGRPYSAREMAAAMRGCSPAEIDAAVTELNALYKQDAAPYEIVGSSNGYRLTLREEFARMRDKFHGRLREARLSPVALEVLSIVAYNQPITAAQVSELRGQPSVAALSTLVRWQLLQIERPADPQSAPTYSTTDRFLRLFGLENLAALPRTGELEKT
jgi:segregation and condensation protein B